MYHREQGHAHPKPYRLGTGLKTVCKLEEKESAHQIADPNVIVYLVKVNCNIRNSNLSYRLFFIMYDKQYVTMCNILPTRAQDKQAGHGTRLGLGWSGLKPNLCSVT